MTEHSDKTITARVLGAPLGRDSAPASPGVNSLYQWVEFLAWATRPAETAPERPEDPALLNRLFQEPGS